MLFRQWRSLISILDESPVFTELSIKEKEALIQDLLNNYPQLYKRLNNEVELAGYEASRLMNRIDF
ncbi:MAG: hypothetical protein HZA14_04000 [Nitrospirae bacterium]|nr:hypothetical protein [Nitrospirota bacterium]